MTGHITSLTIMAAICLGASAIQLKNQVYLYIDRTIIDWTRGERLSAHRVLSRSIDFSRSGLFSEADWLEAARIVASASRRSVAPGRRERLLSSAGTILDQAESIYPESGLISVNAAYLSLMYRRGCSQRLKNLCRPSDEELESKVLAAVARERYSIEVLFAASDTLSHIDRTRVGLRLIRDAVLAGVELSNEQRDGMLQRFESARSLDLFPPVLSEVVEAISKMAEVEQLRTEIDSEGFEAVQLEAINSSSRDEVVDTQGLLLRLLELPVSSTVKSTVLQRMVDLGYAGSEIARYATLTRTLKKVSIGVNVIPKPPSTYSSSIIGWKQDEYIDSPPRLFTVSLVARTGSRPQFVQLRLPISKTGSPLLSATQLWCGKDGGAWQRVALDWEEPALLIGSESVSLLRWPHGKCPGEPLLRIVFERTTLSQRVQRRVSDMVTVLEGGAS